MLEYLLPREVNVKVLIDDFRLRSIITTNETKKFNKKIFIRTVGFNQSDSGPLDVPPNRYIRRISGTYENGKHINITGFDAVHLKCNCINGNNKTGIREHFLMYFALKKLHGHKIYKESNIKLSTK